VTKVTLTFTAEAADYVIIACADYRSYDYPVVYVNLTLDGANVPTGPATIGYANYNTYGLCVLKTLTAGSHTLLLRYYASSGATAYIRNAAILAVKSSLFIQAASTSPSDTSTTSTTFVNIATLSFTSQSGDYVIIGSLRANISGYNTATWRLIDGSSVEQGRSKSERNAAPYTLLSHDILFKVVTLSAGTQTFQLEGASGSGSIVYFDTIFLIALKLPDEKQYAAQEASGTGTRATLAWTPLNSHDIFVIDQTEMSTNNTRSFSRSATTLSSGQSNVLNKTLNGLLEFTATGASESFTTSTAGTSPKSRILALDLTTLTEGEEDIPTQPVAQVMCPIEPQILAEIYPPLDWEGDVLPNALLPVVTGKVVRSGGFEVSWFAVQVADKDERIESVLRYFDPIWIWVQAEGVIERYLYRIESFEKIHSSEGWMVDIRGRSWGGAPLALRGFVDDKDLDGVEISDAIINPTYGLGPTLLPELGCGLYVRNVGRSITVTHTRGTKAKAALDDYKAYAKGTGTEWGHYVCDGDDKDEWGKPNLHFDKVSRDISPIELIVGKTLFLVTGKSIFEFANWQDICYGPWGSEADKIAQPTLGPTIDSYSETNSDTEQALYSGSVVAVGQALTLASDKIIDEAEFYLRKQGTPTGNYVAKLYRATGTVGTDAKPEGNLIASTVEKAISQLTTTKQKIRIPYISPRIGMKGEKYVLAVEYAGGDANNYLVVGCDAVGKTVTAYGNAQIDTAQSKFGGASGLFDGADDYLATPDSNDWYFGTGDFTIDFWIRFNALPTVNTGMATWWQQTDASNYQCLYFWNTAGTYYLYWRVISGGAVIVQMNPSVTITTGTWYHFAVVRSGNNWYLFQGGSQISTVTDTDAVGDYTGSLFIGCDAASGNDFNGWLDEYRVSKGIARWTSNFTPPSEAYSTDSYTKLLLHMNGTDGSTTFIDDSLVLPDHVGNYCSKTGTTWTANSARDLCFYLHSAEHQVGVSPEYRRLVAPGATEAEALAQTLVDAKGVPSIYHVVHTPFTHGIKENSRILILDPIVLLPQIARVNKRAFTIDYDDDGWKRAYLEVTLGGLSFGSTLL